MSTGEKHERFAYSVIFSAIGTVGSRAINVIGALVLARILSPTEFGLLAIVSILTAFTLIFVDVGLGAALVHNRRPTEEDYSTAFAFNVIAGSVLAVALYASAPAIAHFFEDPDGIPVVRAAAFLLVAYGLSMVPQAILQKQRRFRLIAITEVVSSLVALGIAISMALAGYGVWSLIANLYIAATLKFVLSTVFTRWMPRVWPSSKAFSSLWSYSGYLFGSSILDYVSTNFDKIAVGRYFSSERLGSYDLASKLTLLPPNLVIAILGRVLFPTYVAGRENKGEIAKVHIEVLELVAFLLIPFMVALSLYAEDFVAIVLGPKWSEAVIFIEVLSLVYIMRAFAGLNMPIFLAHGATRMHFGLMIFSTVAIVVGVLVGIQFGVVGLLVGIAVGRLMIVLPVLYFPCRLIGLEFGRVILSLAPPVLAGIVSASGILALRALLTDISGSIAFGVASFVLFTFIYLATLFAVRPRFIWAQIDRLRPLLSLR